MGNTGKGSTFDFSLRHGGRVRLNAARLNFISLRQFFIIATVIERQARLISLDSVFPAHLELAGRLIDG